MINNFCLAPLNVLRPVYVKETLGAGAGGLSVLGTALLIGMICAGYGLDVTGRALKEHLDHVRIYPARNRLFCVRDPRTSAGMAGGVCGVLHVHYRFCRLYAYRTYLDVSDGSNAEAYARQNRCPYDGSLHSRHSCGEFDYWICSGALLPPILFSIMGFIMMLPVIFLIRKKSFRAI